MSEFVNVAEQFLGPKGQSDSEIAAAYAAVRSWAEAETSAADARVDRVIGQLKMISAIQLTLFLYLILFVTLRSAIKSMIEALAIERAELAAASSRPPTTIVSIAPVGATIEKSVS
jgi:hypothetical protein